MAHFNIVNIHKEMFRKPGKVLCFMFLFAFSGVDPAQHLSLPLGNSCIVNEHKTKDVQGQGSSNINLRLFVCLFDNYRTSLPFPCINYDLNKHFPRNDL